MNSKTSSLMARWALALVFLTPSVWAQAGVPAIRAVSEVPHYASKVAGLLAGAETSEIAIRGFTAAQFMKANDPGALRLWLDIEGGVHGSVSNDLMDAIAFSKVLPKEDLAIMLRNVPESVLWELEGQLGGSQVVPSVTVIKQRLNDPLVVSTLRSRHWLPSEYPIPIQEGVDHGAFWWKRSLADVAAAQSGNIEALSEIARVEIEAISRGSLVPGARAAGTKMVSLPNPHRVSTYFAKLPKGSLLRLRLAGAYLRRLKTAIRPGSIRVEDQLRLAPGRDISDQEISTIRALAMAVLRQMDEEAFYSVETLKPTTRPLELKIDGTLQMADTMTEASLIRRELTLIHDKLGITTARRESRRPSRIPGKTTRELKKWLNPPKQEQHKLWLKEKGGVATRFDTQIPLATDDGSTAWITKYEFPTPGGTESITRSVLKDGRLFTEYDTSDGLILSWDGPPQDGHEFKPDGSNLSVRWERHEDFTTTIFERTFDEVYLLRHQNGMIDVYAPGEGHIASRLLAPNIEQAEWMEVVPSSEYGPEILRQLHRLKQLHRSLRD